MTTQTITHHGITFDRKALEKFCLKNGIKKLSLFGSVLKDNFGRTAILIYLLSSCRGKRLLLSVSREWSVIYQLSLKGEKLI